MAHFGTPWVLPEVPSTAILPCFDRLFNTALDISITAALVVELGLTDQPKKVSKSMPQHAHTALESDSAYSIETTSPTLPALTGEDPHLCASNYHVDRRSIVAFEEIHPRLYTLAEDRWEAKPDGLLPGLDIDSTGDWSLEVLNAIGGASFATRLLLVVCARWKS
jgi:hypothetical protein